MTAERPLFTRKTALMRRVEARMGGQSVADRLLELFNSKVSSTVAAAELGISTDTYYDWLFQLRGVNLGFNKEETRQALEKAEELYAQGFPLYHIVKETRLTIPTIKNHVGK